MAALGLAEFFVTCNPPLLANGVQQVIEDARSSLGARLIEILYEPEIPWFKIITLTDDRADATEVVQRAILRMADDVVNYPDSVSLTSSQDPDRHVDLVISGNNQQFTVWSTYNHSELASSPDFDEFRFPDTVRPMQHKAVWRLPVDDIDALLSQCKRGPFAFEVPGTLMEVDKSLRFQCEWTSNIRNTMLYLGCDEGGEEQIREISLKLDSFMQTLSVISRLPHGHIIMVQGGVEVMTTFRWLSHIGLSDRTHTFGTETLDVASSATLRTSKKVASGSWQKTWQTDQRVYPLAASDVDRSKIFKPFLGYTYKSKREVSSRPVGICHIRTMERLAMSTPASHQTTHGFNNLHSIQLDPRVEDWVNRHRSGLLPRSRTPSHGGAGDNLIDQGSDTTQGFGTTASTAGPMSPHTSHETDTAGHIGTPQHRGNGHDHTPLTPAAVDSYKTVPYRGVHDKQEDLIDLEVPLVSARLQHAMLDDDDSHKPVTFGIAEEKVIQPKQTMNQKAGRKSGRTWANTANPANSSSARSAPRGIVEVNPSEKTIDSMVDSLSSGTAKILEALPFIPGKVTLEMKLGRLLVRNLAPADVHSGQDGGTWTLQDMHQYLNNDNCDVNFQSILTCYGAEADHLSEMRAAGYPRWQEPATTVTYEFYCVLQNTGFAFKIAVDAATFESSTEGITAETSSISVFWPEHAWDMKLCVSRAQSSNLPPECAAYARHVASALQIKPEKSGDAVIEVTHPFEQTSATILYGTIKHVARYKSKASEGGLLTITMTRPLERISVDQSSPVCFKGKTYFTNRKDFNKHQKPGEYFEASISSPQMETVLQENVTIGFGGKTRGAVADLDIKRILTEICRPAASMIPRMDVIGMTRVYVPPATRDTSARGSQARTDQGTRYEFW